MNDPYRVLGVDRGADSDAIRKQFKKLARQFHPDVNKAPDAEDRFKEINTAYGILGDEDKRKAWDEFGEVSTRPGFDAEKARQYRQSGGNPFGRGGVEFEFGGGDMDDLLSSLFAGGGVGGRMRRGQDVRAAMTVDFMTSILGGERELTVPRPNGSSDRIKVRIPPGVRDGGKLKIAGQGLPPRGGGPCGDLHLELSVPEHPNLRRVGDDLEMDLPLTVLEAMAGASITVPTPTGDVKVTVPAGSKVGQRLRLKGRGVQKSVPGHLVLVLQPTPPVSEDPEVLEAARKLEAAYTEDVRAGLTL